MRRFKTARTCLTCSSWVSGVDQDVINVYNYRLVQHVSEYVIYKRLENGRTIGEPEGHNKILIVATAGGEGGIPFIPCSDVNEVIG